MVEESSERVLGVFFGFISFSFKLLGFFFPGLDSHGGNTRLS